LFAGHETGEFFMPPWAAALSMNMSPLAQGGTSGGLNQLTSPNPSLCACGREGSYFHRRHDESNAITSQSWPESLAG
jgi:hypothetical protein